MTYPFYSFTVKAKLESGRTIDYTFEALEAIAIDFYKYYNDEACEIFLQGTLTKAGVKIVAGHSNKVPSRNLRKPAKLTK